MSGSSARVLLGAVRELATTSAGTKFDSLLLIFLVGTAYFWSWLPDPEDSQVNDILNPSHSQNLGMLALQNLQEGEQSRLGRSQTVVTVLPHDESGKEEHADAACGSMHATWAHATREGHLSMLFFSAGFGFFQLFMWVNYYSILDTSWPTENVVTLFLLFFGGWFYGYLYDREGMVSFCGYPFKMWVVQFNLTMNFLGSAAYAYWTLAEPDADQKWIFYVLAIFMFASIMGLQCLCQVLVADLMPAGAGAAHGLYLKQARLYGGYVMFFGLGVLVNVLLFSIFSHSTDDSVRKWAWRSQGIGAALFYLLTMGAMHMRSGPQFEDLEHRFGPGKAPEHEIERRPSEHEMGKL